MNLYLSSIVPNSRPRKPLELRKGAVDLSVTILIHPEHFQSSSKVSVPAVSLSLLWAAAHLASSVLSPRLLSHPMHTQALTHQPAWSKVSCIKHLLCARCASPHNPPQGIGWSLFQMQGLGSKRLNHLPETTLAVKAGKVGPVQSCPSRWAG